MSDYWVMNLVVFAVLFPTGFAAGRKVSFPFWIVSVLLLVSAIVGLNAQVAVDTQLILDSYLGVMTGLTIGVVISRLAWPRLPQRLLHKKLVCYFAACEKFLGEASSERIEELSSRITLTPMEALSYAQAMGVDRRLQAEETKVMALLPVLISLSVDLNSLVSFKSKKPTQIIEVLLRPTFDELDQIFRRLLRTYRKFLELGCPLIEARALNANAQQLINRITQILSVHHSKQVQGDRMERVFTEFSRYLATAEAFTACTALLSTLDREELVNDNVL
jgi:hypothetical protein